MDENEMKYFLTIAIFLFLVSCAQPVDKESDNNISSPSGDNDNKVFTQLTIKNESSVFLRNVKWNNISFGAIPARASVLRDVEAGNGYVFLTKNAENLDCRSTEWIAVNEGQSREFVIYDNTEVLDITDMDNKTSLDKIALRKTTLTIQNNSSFTISDIRWGNLAINSISAGSSVTRETSSGSSFILFTKNSVNLSCRTIDTFFLSEKEELIFTLTNETMVLDINDTDNINALSQISKRLTRLIIKNNSAKKITGVNWQGVQFGDINIGAEVIRDVSEDSGFIYFKIDGNSVPANTRDAVNSRRYEDSAFTFTDNTPVKGIDIYNAIREGTLSELSGGIWTPVWMPPGEYETNLFLRGPRAPTVLFASVLISVRAGDVYWHRISTREGLTQRIILYNHRSNPSLTLGSFTGFTANVVMDIYRQDGTIYQSSIEDGTDGILFTSNIDQYLYIKITVNAEGNGRYALFYEYD
ncbi:MAG: hypothetical protein LBQ89_04885 [Treponema sp.]|nr:hypothetical protein [Treponema sp.]